LNYLNNFTQATPPKKGEAIWPMTGKVNRMMSRRLHSTIDRGGHFVKEEATGEATLPTMREATCPNTGEATPPMTG